MRIAMISTPFVSVPPKDYGGTELVVHALVEGLIGRGHEVTLFATRDSMTSAELRFLYEAPCWPPNPLDDFNHASWAMREIQNGPFDLIHAHSCAALACSRFVPGVPIVYTVHHERDESLSAYPDGRLPEPPIALVEVQGYVHDAKLRMAQMLRVLGHGERAESLNREAESLRAAIHEHFWMDDPGTFAIALDGQKNPIPTATSNAGHLLWSRVPTPEQARRMAEHFLSSDMFCGWGVRTLSAAHRVYNPMSYHNGSVWPHDNAIVALGLALAGHTHAALPILSALHDVSRTFTNHRLPELFCGMERATSRGPVHYPVSCIPQAWAAGSFYMMLQAVTGLLPDAPAGILHVRNPQLPEFLRELTVSSLAVGGSKVTMQFSSEHGQTVAKLLAIEGDPLKVAIEL